MTIAIDFESSTVESDGDGSWKITLAVNTNSAMCGARITDTGRTFQQVIGPPTPVSGGTWAGVFDNFPAVIGQGGVVQAMGATPSQTDPDGNPHNGWTFSILTDANGDPYLHRGTETTITW